MKIEIQAVAKFWIALTPEHVDVLKKCAEYHYDAVCRDSAVLGGFIYGWGNLVTLYPDTEKMPKCSASFRELDTAMKILENCSPTLLTTPEEQALAREMNKSFLAAMLHANDRMSQIVFYLD